MVGALVLLVIICGVLIFSYKRNLRLFEKITASEATVRSLSFQATHDTLTGLNNRRGFDVQLKNTHARALRNQEKYALLCMDLDGFKAVNDQHGHDTGDALLIEVAKRFTKSLREYDYLARLGGDEFSVLVTQHKTRIEIAQLAKRLIKTLDHPILINGIEIKVGVSIGIAEFPDTARSIKLLTDDADSAMYASKHMGKNRYSFA